MSHRRRTLAALVALPVWIVMILTGGQWCLMPAEASAHPVVSSAALVGHSAVTERSHDAHASGKHEASNDARAGQPNAHAATAPSPEGADHGPTRCESQAACSVAIVPAPVLAGAPVEEVPAHPLRVRGDRLPSLTQTPEIPPPRA